MDVEERCIASAEFESLVEDSKLCGDWTALGYMLCPAAEERWLWIKSAIVRLALRRFWNASVFYELNAVSEVNRDDFGEESRRPPKQSESVLENHVEVFSFLSR